MKKFIKKIMIYLLVGIISLSNMFTNVLAYSDKDTFSSRTITGQYIKKLHSDGSGKYKSIGFLTRNSDGHYAYCVQPWLELGEGDLYDSNSSNQAEILGVSSDTWRRISLIAYYGYGYIGHTDERWYGITQLMIWKTVDPTGDFFFTYTLNGNRDYRYDWMKDEIETLIANHYVRPEFNVSNISLSIGESITLTDTNSILDNYTLSSNGNVTATKNGNNVVITANNVGEGLITLTKNLSEEGTDNVTVLYNYLDKQKVISRGLVDPVRTTVNINVVGGKIKAIKVDKETGQITAQGSASMIGTIIDVYDSNNNIVDTLTIGNDSTATSIELPKGNYRLIERQAGTGYKLSNQIYNVTISDSSTQNVTIENEIIKGRIKIYKYDSETKTCNPQSEALLIGAKYSVTNSKGQVVDTLTIGNDCSSTSNLLPYDTYKVKEISSPTGYNIDNNIYTININSESTLDLVVYDKVIKGKVRIYKKDFDSNNTTSKGQATLVGAKYGVYDMNDNLVDTLTIDDEYQAISKELPYGHYKVKEIKASEGYKVDTNVYEVNINEESEIEDVVSKEKVIENYISILKQYDFIDGQTSFLNAEAGITFEIYYLNGYLYNSITTDKHGYATISIPYGVWKFHQVNTNTGYEKISDFYITVDDKSESEQYYNILNNKLSAYLQVFKIDSETNKKIAIANTKFKILNTDTNQYVSQYVGGKVYDTFKTDSEGKFITYLKLEAGNYKLVEISSPKGYLLNSDGLEFTIGEDTHYTSTNYGTIVTVSFKDKPIKGIIEINKNGEVFNINDDTFNYNGRKNLEGIVFKVEALEDIKSSDGKYIYYEKGTIVDTITTNNIGYAKTKKLPLGKYIVYEYETSDLYKKDANKYKVELKEKDNKTEIVYSKLKLTNKLKKGELEFTKTDLVTGDVIPNTDIEIYTELDELIFKGKTNDEGKIIIKNLPLNQKFYIIETSCEGYVITNEKVYFEIKEDGEIVKAEMKNKPITSDLEFTKLDYSTDKPIENTVIEIYNEKNELEFTGKTDEEGKVIIKNIKYGKHYIVEKEAPEKYTLNNEKMWFEVLEDGKIIKSTMKDKVKTSKIKIHKVDQDNNSIEGVEIGIYDLEDRLIYSSLTDSNGDIETTLEYGSYYFQEIAGVDGYIKSDEKVYFDITTDGDYIQKTLVNQLEVVEVPNTFKNEFPIVELITILLISIGVVIIYYGKDKPKK